MADIRNDQYLHRPTAGRGAITPADPLEVLLHSGGQPISSTNRLPVEATLSGREVEIVINATTEVANQNLVLRAGGFGTSLSNVSGIDTSKYRILALFVHNGMDVQIRLSDYMAYFNDLPFNQSPYPNRIVYPLDIAIPSGASRHITIVDIPQMDKEAYPHVRSIWRFNTSGKTDGELRVIVMGVPW